MEHTGGSHQESASSNAHVGAPRAQFDLIWNTTLICPWDCGMCCVDAVHVVGDAGNVKLRSQGLQRTEVIEATGAGTRYDIALRHLQSEGRELTWEGKLALLDNLKGESVRLDISGGDALVVREGRDLLREASFRLGRHNVTLTVTGAGLRKQDIAMAAEAIGEFNFTYDPGTADTTQLRPTGYAASNLQLAKHMSRLGVPVRAEMPLTRFALAKQTLEKSYKQLADAGVQHLLLMRLFAVGRGLVNEHAIPTRREYLEAIEILQNCEARMKGPRVKLQCALRHIVPGTGLQASSRNPCDLVTASFGLMANGTLLASPWAIGPTGAPLDPSFVLGNLAEDSFAQLRSGAVAKELTRRANDNFGHCKIFAFQHSEHSDPVARMTDNADPLFVEDRRDATKVKKPGIFWVKPEPK